MWVRQVVFTVLATASLASAHAAERLPFHVSQFPGNVTVNLTVTSMQMSPIGDYDYEVIIGLTEVVPSGAVKFNDTSSHAAQVKCLPGKVFVGGTAYFPQRGARGTDWKEDLWESVCLSPIS
jgi:hypothetical protein